jgi:asparagine synthase (glutamine-hydrolysing)
MAARDQAASEEEEGEGMAGAYIVQKNRKDDLHETARLISSALAFSGEPVNHYCIAGHTLLGLISPDKLRKGIMPVYLPRERLWALLMGELHESDCLTEFRKSNPDVGSDPAVFARLFRTGALNTALPRLSGAFFVVLYDPKDDLLVAANDRYGLYPMYWAHTGRGFCLSSRVLGPVLAGIVDGDWDLEGIAQFLTIDDYLGETAPVSGVKAFPQATVLTKQAGKLSFHTYWHYDFTPHSQTADGRELAEELGQRFLAAVKRQALRPGRIGVTLSGGLDSRSLLAAASRLGIEVQTFTWGERDSFDRILAGKVSRLYGTRHHDCDYAHYLIPDRFDEGIRMSEGLINYFDCHMLFHLHILKEHADIVLNGYAGDLVLGGSYLRRAWMTSEGPAELARKLFQWRNTLLREGALKDAIPDLDRLEEHRYPSRLFHAALSRMDEGLAPADMTDRFFLENRVRRSTSMGTVIMREAVESAACFFDYHLIDLITSIPFSLRYGHRIYRDMLKTSLPESLKVRWQRTLLPAYAPCELDLPAKAFLKGCGIVEQTFGWHGIASRQSPVNFSSLLRGILRPWMDSIICEPCPLSEEVLLPDFCERTWERHLSGENLTRLLGAIAGIRGFAALLSRARARVVGPLADPVEIRPRA